MNEREFDYFSEIVVGFAELKGKSLSSAAIKLYWAAMQPWTLEDFRAAAIHLLNTCEFMPTPGDFQKLRKAGKPTAAEAWSRIMQHTKSAYRDGSGLDDGGPIDTAVAGLGGYKAIAFHDLDYLPILQRQFVERFAEQADVADTRSAIPHIAAPPPQSLLRGEAGPRKLGDVKLGEVLRKLTRE